MVQGQPLCYLLVVMTQNNKLIRITESQLREMIIETSQKLIREQDERMVLGAVAQKIIENGPIEAELRRK